MLAEGFELPTKVLDIVPSRDTISSGRYGMERGKVSVSRLDRARQMRDLPLDHGVCDG